MQRMLASMKNLFAAGLAHGCSRFEDNIEGSGWLVANWVEACGINAK
jgi:hypothetical protein